MKEMLKILTNGICFIDLQLQKTSIILFPPLRINTPSQQIHLGVNVAQNNYPNKCQLTVNWLLEYLWFGENAFENVVCQTSTMFVSSELC